MPTVRCVYSLTSVPGSITLVSRVLESPRTNKTRVPQTFSGSLCPTNVNPQTAVAMLRRKLSFVNGECANAGALTECFVESDIQRQIRDRFDEECPYSLTRRSARSPRTTRNCSSQVWQVAVNTVAKKRDSLRRSVNSVFRSVNKIRTGFRAATQVRSCRVFKFIFFFLVNILTVDKIVPQVKLHFGRTLNKNYILASQPLGTVSNGGTRVYIFWELK